MPPVSVDALPTLAEIVTSPIASEVPYYDRELNAIRVLAAEFAQANPKVAGRLRLVEREAAGQRQPRDRLGELAGLGRIMAKLAARSALGQPGLKRAARLGAADAGAIVIEQMRVEPAAAQIFDQAARLPVGAVIDALVEGENTHPFAVRHRAKESRASARVPLSDLR